MGDNLRLVEPLEPRRLFSQTLLKDIVPGTGSGRADHFAEVGGIVLFTATTDWYEGSDLWKTDGTPGGTDILYDFPTGFTPDDLSVHWDNQIVFRVGSSTVSQLWITDGTHQGTRQLFSSSSATGMPIWFGEMGEKFLFGSDRQLWISDGTPQGTKRVAPDVSFVGNDWSYVGFLNGVAYFMGTGPQGSGLYRTDGTDDGTTLAATISTDHDIKGFVAGPQYLYFQRDGLSGGVEYTDGTQAGTGIVAPSDHSLQMKMSWPKQLGQVEGQNYFISSDLSGPVVYPHPQIVWRLNGKTADPTDEKVTLLTGWRSDLTVNGVHYVSHDAKLFRRDGDRETLIHDSVDTGSLRNIGNRLLFRAGDNEFWSTDGTATGTVKLTDAPGVIVFGQYLNGRVIVQRDTSEFSYEPWAIDVDPNPKPFASIDGQVLRINGSDAGDQIILGLVPGNPRRLQVTVNGVSAIFTRTRFRSTAIDAGDGDDTIRADTIAIPCQITAGAGDDAVYGSQAADRIWGGDGNDWINGGAGNETLYGDAGDDRLFGGDGKDVLSGGAGANVLRAGGGRDRVLYHVGLDNIKGNGGDELVKLV